MKALKYLLLYFIGAYMLQLTQEVNLNTHLLTFLYKHVNWSLS